MKFCKDCVYCDLFVADPAASFCTHEKAIAKLDSYPVDGGTRYTLCLEMRGIKGQCHPGGILWLKKE